MYYLALIFFCFVGLIYSIHLYNKHSNMDKADMKDDTTHEVYLQKMVIYMIGYVIIIIAVLTIWVTR